MKILGICGSPRKEILSGTHRLINTVLKATDCDYEVISLRGMKISGCIACLGCVEDNVCKLEDDFAPIREKLIQADAYVIGAPNYYSGLNAITHAFMERLFQFRHQEGNLLWGKLGVAVGVGGTVGQFPADEIEKFFLYNFIETVAKVIGRGAASCYSCGHGETCKVGIPYLLHGERVKITPETTPDVIKLADVMTDAVNAGKLLGKRLGEGHDRMEVTRKMQNVMMNKFQSTV
ncbi:MAG: flavodoxin family protein [Syntrophobacteraceae bacterium]